MKYQDARNAVERSTNNNNDLSVMDSATE